MRNTWIGSAARLTWAALLTGLLACGSQRPDSLGQTTGPTPPAPCAKPGTAGCACTVPGATAACGEVVTKSGNYVSCSMGNATCDGAAWGPCIGNVIVSKSLSPPTTAGGLHFSALGMPGVCPAGSNPCDPECNQTVDDPTSGFTAPAGFKTGPLGLSLSGVVSVPCTSLTVTPSVSSVVVTSLTTPTTITLTATAAPAGCATSPFTTLWTIDDVNEATISGTNNTNGVLTLQASLPGTTNVTAYGAGTNGTTAIAITLRIVDTTGIAPDTAASATQAGKFYTGGVTSAAPLPGTTASTASWLYPYANTYLPLALPAPIVQYKYAVAPGTSPNSAVKLSLRYPAGSTEAAATFNYATIITESTPDPQIYILQSAWQRFEQSARGNNASLVVQRWTGGAGGVLENETSRTIHFVDGQLKGTVFYNTYSSPQGGGTGAVLSIAPGATTPTLAVQPGGYCTTCHSVNSDGSKLITSGGVSGTSGVQDNTVKQYNIAAGGFPSPAVLLSWPGTTDHSPTSDKFAYGAVWKDGSLYMTYGGSGTGDVNLHAPAAPSQLYDPSNSGTAKTVTGWGTDEQAVSPKFSTDGTKLGFGFWGGAALSQSPSGTLASDPTGSTLAVVDFSCNANCTSGWTISNARAVTSPTNLATYVPLAGAATFHVTNGSTTVTATGSNFTNDLTPPQYIAFGAQAGVRYTVASVASNTSLTLSANYTGSTSTTSTATFSPLYAWPTFLPDNSGVIYQRQIVGSSAYIVITAPSNINTRNGAQADLWISNIPATSATAAIQTRLNALNGLDAAGVSYLPTTSRTVAPPTAYHSGHLTIPFTVADRCTVTGTALDVSDTQLNYLPAVNPTQAGGFNWVVFTTRRMYGNIAYANPWDANPNQACTSGVPLTKKLWVSAIDGTLTPGTDPSHPAFYLPGQELAAGNSNGEWVNTPCANIGASCTIADDCCGGTGGSPTTTCQITTAPATKTCVALGGACVAAGGVCNTAGSPGDCCTGLTCPGAGGKCFNPIVITYTPQTYTREFVASCPVAGTRPVWRFFQWQSTVPSGASIVFSAQTKELASDTYAPAMPLGIGTASATTAGTTWGQGPQTVDTVLVGAGLPSKPYLLVTMVFNPDPSQLQTPALKAWQQNFDCVAAQ